MIALMSSTLLARGTPPFPFLTWTEAAVKSWLKQQGFDLARPIVRTDDLATHSIRFFQEDPSPK